jgi:hypothetical protein
LDGAHVGVQTHQGYRSTFPKVADQKEIEIVTPDRTWRLRAKSDKHMETWMLLLARVHDLTCALVLRAM